jgi:hypothetical protein
MLLARQLFKVLGRKRWLNMFHLAARNATCRYL